MVEKCTSEMFVLGVVETSSYIFGGLLLMYLSSISQICLVAYGHIVKNKFKCVCINFEKSNRFLTHASCDYGLFRVGLCKEGIRNDDALI